MNTDEQKCKHEGFKAEVNVALLKDSGRFLAEIHINCAQCGAAFRFLGLPCGLDLDGAAVSPEGTEMRVAIGTDETIANIIDGDCPVGFTVRKA